MALDPKKLQQAKDLLDQIDKIYRSIGQQNPFQGVDPDKIATSEKEIKRLEVALSGVIKKANDLEEGFGGIAASIGLSLAEMNKQNNAVNSTVKAMRGLKGIADDLKNDQADLSQLSLKELENRRDKAKILSQEAKLQAEEVRQKYEGFNLDKNGKALAGAALDKRLKSLGITKSEAQTISEIIGLKKDELKIVDELNVKIEERIKKEKQINENLGITGALLKGAEGFLNKIGLGILSNAIGFDEINKKVREFAEELEKTEPNLSEAEKKQRVMRKGFELMGESIKKSLNDPLTVASIAITGLVKIAGLVADGFKRSQENTGALAKGLNITNGEAMQLSKSMSAASFGSDRLFVSSKGLTETLVAINSELGTSVQLSTEELLTFTKLRETAGLTNAELMGIQKLSLANGESFDENADSILNQVSALNRASGIYLNEKEVLKDISKLSAATTLSLGKNPVALAEAVATAKSLGIEMSKLDGIANSLLDFESSISAELEAELLLGKNINLEKARQAALNNDLATLAKEIADQAGTAEEFGRMNRIQQEAIAKAVGMNREDLAQTLFVQEQLAGVSGEEAERRQKLLDTRIEEVGLAQAQRELEKNGLENMLNQATASEKMQASQEKINELFTAFGAMFAPIVDMFANVAGFIMESKLAMGVLAAIAGGLVGVLSAMAAKSIVSAISAIFTGAASLGPFGIPLAMGGVAALIGAIAAGASAATAVGDVMSPSDGKTQVSTKEGGLFELSPNDDLVAAPGAVERMKNGGSTTVVQQSPPPDNTESKRTNQYLQELIKLSARPSVFQIGTDEFYTRTAKYSYQVQ
jgi:hypothetical protein